MESKSKISFYGGVGTVTGANFLLETGEMKILVDCGLDQSKELCKECNYDEFQYNPKDIDILFVTHAHLDHIGRIPKLVHDGFSGIIYSTPSTMKLAQVMFDDGIRLLKDEAKRLHREPLYNEDDVRDTMKLWKPIEYHTKIPLKNPDYTAYLKDAGHILGSAIIEIEHKHERGNKKFVFTGDLGNSPTPLLRDTEVVDDADYLLMESVYGDRNHETSITERTELLRDVIKDAVSRGGTIIIPAFSIERTQIILHELNNLVEAGDLPKIPTFLDSPLAIKVTEIYKEHTKNFNKDIQKEIKGGDNIFDFPKLEFTETRRDSKKINDTQGAKIIIAGAGMSHGGRIMFHERIYLHDPNNTILFVGYQVPGTTGRQIQDGNKSVQILGKKVKVRARVEIISGFSAHKGSDDLIEFASKSHETLKKVFVSMGELKSSNFVAQHLRDYYDIDAVVPKKDESFEIDF